MTVVVPSDPLAVARLLPQVAAWDGPVFFRLCRNEVPVLFDERYDPRIGTAMVHREGADLSLIGTGIMVSRCVEAADILASRGIRARVIEVHTIKPLDTECILRAAKETGAIVTAEEHSIIGGLGSAVAETVAASHPVPVIRTGIADRFAETGAYAELLDSYGMSVDDIVRAGSDALKIRRT